MNDLLAKPNAFDQFDDKPAAPPARAIAARAADIPGSDAMLRQMLQIPAEMNGAH